MQFSRTSAEDRHDVAHVLAQAAAWLRSIGQEMWLPHEIDADAIADHVAAGMYYLARQDGVAIGVFRFQLRDELFWPEDTTDSAAYVHRLAVHPEARGHGVARVLLAHAVSLARSQGRQFLRLDCDHGRPALRKLYEDFGFQFDSSAQVGRFFVAKYSLPL